MNKLFIELYLDEDVHVMLARMLQARGFVAATARDAGQLRKTDAEQFEYAIEHSMTLLSHNRVHFEQLARQYFESGRSHSGLILAVHRPPRDLLGLLLPILNVITADEMQNRILYI